VTNYENLGGSIACNFEMDQRFVGVKASLYGTNILSIQNTQKNLIIPKVIPKKFYG
jgi:hypothetical protein